MDGMEELDTFIDPLNRFEIIEEKSGRVGSEMLC